MIDENLRAVVLSLLLFAIIFTAYQGFLPERSLEPFSELAILGPEKNTSNYPQQLLVNQEFTLYIYVGNHEGELTYYQVIVKLGNRSLFINETTPMEAPIIRKYEKILADNQTWIYPVQLSIDEPGINQRLVFEMWIFDSHLKDFKYHGKWNQLWLNVTTPVLSK